MIVSPLNSAFYLLRLTSHCPRFTSYIAVAYVNHLGYAEGIPFGPDFPTEDDCWKWLMLGECTCVPVHDYIEVESATI